VRLLFDQNLSYRLVDRLADIFPQATHVRLLALDRAPDDQIWEHARANEFCIVTQDADFAERSRLYGAPPKVVWLRCGNSTPEQVEILLRANWVMLLELIQNPALHCIELS
jgi:predicted nuclease of predicted toxin-antitoxin system